MQGFARHSFFGLFLGSKKRAFWAHFALKPLLACCEGSSLEIPSLRPSRQSLYNKKDVVLRRGITDGFYFRDTVRAEGIKSHAVLRIDEVFI